MQMQRHRAILSCFHVAALAELLVTGGAVHLRSTRAEAGEQFFAFDYSQHGQDWVAGTCSSRSRQSPIDLPASAPMVGSFEYKYEPVTQPFDLINNGHSFSADFAGMGYGGLTYDDAWYGLMNINVHSVSEHAWAGVKKPLELHLVHKHYATDKLLIIAIAVESATPLPTFLQFNTSSSSFLKSGKQGPRPAPFSANYVEPPTADADFNPLLQAFLRMPPPPINMKVSVPVVEDDPLDFNSWLQGSSFYEYAGSLTAPPCAEIAQWLVRKDPIKGSDKQVLYLHDAIYKTTADFGNYRMTMPLNGRVVTMRQAMIENPPKTPPHQMGANEMGGTQQSDREFRAMKWAMDAMTIAKGATDYIKDLDMRVRNAAEAHAEALAPDLEPLGGMSDMQHGGAKPGAAGMPGMPGGDIQMQGAAEEMARTLADAAHEEVEDATKQITAKAKEAALEAARQAAKMVDSGMGNQLTLSNLVEPGVGAPPPPLR